MAFQYDPGKNGKPFKNNNIYEFLEFCSPGGSNKVH